MEQDVELLEPEVKPQRVPWRDRREVQIALKVAGGLAATGLVIILILYFKYARMIDRRLEEGPFANATGIYTTPRPVGVGDAFTKDQVVQRLRRSGYTTARDNPTGWFQESPHAVEITPGAESFTGTEPARIEFKDGKISSIVSLRNRSGLKEYLLDPQLIANVSENREKRVMVHFRDIPKSLVTAVTSVEDKRFFRHSGFDPIRIVKAAYIDVKEGRKDQGASTLSMQLTRSLWLDPGKRWERKFREILITAHIEQKLTKEQIFEYYANEVYLGRRGTFALHGFGSAARAFFGKELGQIHTAEAALLAGLVQRPSYYNPVRYPDRAHERRDLVLGMMLNNKHITTSEYREALAQPVNIVPASIDPTAAPYFTALLQDELQTRLADDRKRIHFVATTLDPDLQMAAEEAVKMGMENVDRQLRGRKGHATPGQPQVALIALDPRTGEIKALVGGREYGASQLNHAISQRQPGSVFKPFVYTAAIATAVEGGSRMFTPASVIADEATTFYFDRNQVYQPGNFHGNYMGDVTLRTALAHSLNNATVSLAQQVGLAKVVQIAQRAGLNNRIKATPSVALGAYEATPLEIAGAYTVFANQGMHVTPTTIASVRAADGTLLHRHTPDSRAALDPRVAGIMVDMLQEVMRSGTAAGARARGVTQPAAGKTGTSRDGWFAGFTTELLCVVWVGYDDNRELGLEGSKSAMPVWAEFMKRAAQYRPYKNAREFPASPGIVSAKVCKESGQLAGIACPNVRGEKFIAGTEPGVACALHANWDPIAAGDADRAMPGLPIPLPLPVSIPKR